MNTIIQDVCQAILSHMDAIHGRLANHPDVAVPAPDRMAKLVHACAFRTYEESDEYLEDAHPFDHRNHTSHLFGDYAFRVYYDADTGRVRVDLNRERMTMIRLAVETEFEAFCEIVRSILVADPQLFR